jgi:hypothetical protein
VVHSTPPRPPSSPERTWLNSKTSVDSSSLCTSTMKRINAVRLLVTDPLKYHVHRAGMSSLVETTSHSQCNLPLMLLSTPVPSLETPAYGTPRPTSLAPYYQSPKTRPTSEVVQFVWPARNLQAQDWHVTPLQYLPPIQLLKSIQLQNKSNPEPFKEGKPKWEEEQFPDIGKSTHTPSWNMQANTRKRLI